MKRIAATTLLALAGTLMGWSALAKLPAPGDEAKAKAAETAAKTAHPGKAEASKPCKRMTK